MNVPIWETGTVHASLVLGHCDRCVSLPATEPVPCIQLVYSIFRITLCTEVCFGELEFKAGLAEGTLRVVRLMEPR